MLHDQERREAYLEAVTQRTFAAAVSIAGRFFHRASSVASSAPVCSLHPERTVYCATISCGIKLILQTAVRGRLSQQELPGTVLVISDMEFDMAVSGNGKRTLFDTIGRRFAAHGYRMPKLVFWNVNSRTNVIPVRENERSHIKTFSKIAAFPAYRRNSTVDSRL